MESLLIRRESIAIVGEQLIVVTIKRVAQQVVESDFKEGFLLSHLSRFELQCVAIGIGGAVMEHRSAEFRMVCPCVFHMDIIHTHRNDFGIVTRNLRNNFFFLFARQHGH